MDTSIMLDINSACQENPDEINEHISSNIVIPIVP